MNTTRASLRLAAMAGAALLAGGLGVAHAADATQNKGASDQVVATVNGTKLTTRDLASFSRSMAPQGQQINREEALQGLVDRELHKQKTIAKWGGGRPGGARGGGGRGRGRGAGGAGGGRGRGRK